MGQDVKIRNMEEGIAHADEVRVKLGSEVGPVASNYIKVLSTLALAGPRSEGKLDGFIREANEFVLILRNKMKEFSREHPELDLTEIDVL